MIAPACLWPTLDDWRDASFAAGELFECADCHRDTPAEVDPDWTGLCRPCAEFAEELRAEQDAQRPPTYIDDEWASQLPALLGGAKR